MTARIEYEEGQRSSVDGSMLSFIRRVDGHPRNAIFLCDCGEETITAIANWKNGHTRSCGCSKGSLTSKAKTTHGQSHTPLHRIWCSLKRSNRAGRCERWDDFEIFVEDMGDTWFPGAHLARKNEQSGEIDVGIYEPGNCRWITPEDHGRETLNRIHQQRRQSK